MIIARTVTITAMIMSDLRLPPVINFGCSALKAGFAVARGFLPSFLDYPVTTTMMY